MDSIINKVNRNKRANFIKIMMITVLIVAITIFIFITGGTQMVFVHLLYIPIILSSLFWGHYGGLTVGIICGLAAGPLMPLDVFLESCRIR